MKNDYNLWLKKASPVFARELQLIKDDSTEIEKRFAQKLTFGTAGLRGILGAGTARINIYTVGGATQSFAEMLKLHNSQNSVCIAYDSRIDSELLAKTTAEVFAANGIKVYIFDRLMPTPTLSFALRELACTAGVMITASHNPAEYNGYKAYGADGGQLVPEIADGIAKSMAKLDLFEDVKRIEFKQGIKDGMISYVEQKILDRYIEEVCRLSLYDDTAAKSKLKIVYTPLNGAGLECVITVLNQNGFNDITIVEEQRKPDGNFPTCTYPNPEMPEAMSLGIKLCGNVNGDVLIATDPDSDRMGVALGNGKLFTGNEIGALLLDYICEKRSRLGTMPQNPIIIRSVVSADLVDKIAADYGIAVKTVLTGFKYVGEVITELAKQGKEDDFIFGYEESHGYLSGCHVRDKDAVNACLLICEMAAEYKQQALTLNDRLESLYNRYGYCYSVVYSYAFSGTQPMAEMQAVMNNLRNNPLDKLAGNDITEYMDFLDNSKTGLDKADILKYNLATDAWVIIRPSGTEPKLKLYFNITAQTENDAKQKAQIFKKYFDGILLG
ncbi:MAG: phospho-sugar mutase [Oscillospiraceae bacterium]